MLPMRPAEWRRYWLPRREKTILGVHIVGGYATELLSSAIVGVTQGMTVDDFERIIMPHPTMSELVREAVLDAEKRAIHKPKAK